MVAAEVVGVPAGLMVLAMAIVLVGAATQASIGVGLGLLAAPTLSLIDPAFIPGALTVAMPPLVVGMAWREREHIDRTIYRAVPTRFIGSVAGAVLVAKQGERAVAAVVGVAVLLAVVASLTRLHFRPTLRNQLLAGTASGFAGTVAGVGGPPMAITYQHTDPRVLRASLAAFNSIGLIAFTLPSLAIAGVIGRREVQLACFLVPGVIAGLIVGKYTIAKLPPERVRPFVLAVCAGSALLVLGRALA
jgi:uncharacterized membrane protein YfcA